MQTKTAYIGLGSNIGERRDTLVEAVRRIAGIPGVQLRAASDLYETDPVGFVDQPPFLNMAVRVDTSLEPEQLLDALLKIELQMGRVRDVRWGPRTLDLDLLLYGGPEPIETPRLSVPHPRMLERRFVLVPLLDVADPGDKALLELIKLALERLHDEGGVIKWTTINWPDASERSEN